MFADLSQKLGVGTGKNKDNRDAAAPQVNAGEALRGCKAG